MNDFGQTPIYVPLEGLLGLAAGQLPDRKERVKNLFDHNHLAFEGLSSHDKQIQEHSLPRKTGPVPTRLSFAMLVLLNEEPLLNSSGCVGGRHACPVKRGLPRKTWHVP